MKKLKILYYAVNIVLLLILFILGILLLNKKFPIEMAILVYNIFFIVFLLFAVNLIIYIIALVGLVMKRGIHNIKKFDDETFNIIDQYKSCFIEDNQYYKSQIQIINLYYKKMEKLTNL